MAANSGVRAISSRSPPFLVIGLCVALCILGFYYWNLSSRNSDFAFEVEQLRATIRLETSKTSHAVKRTDTVLQNLQECEQNEQKDKSIIADKESNIKSITEQLQGKTDELNNLKKTGDECGANLKKCQTDTSGIRDELQKLKDDSTKRETELTALKAAAEEDKDKKCDCTSALQEQRKQIETILEKSVGQSAVQALADNGIGKPVDPAQGQGPPQPGNVALPANMRADKPVAPETDRHDTDGTMKLNNATDTAEIGFHGFGVPANRPQLNIPGNRGNSAFQYAHQQQPAGVGLIFDQRNHLIKKDAAEVVDGQQAGLDVGKIPVGGGVQGKPLPGGIAAEEQEEDLQDEKEMNAEADNDGDVVGKVGIDVDGINPDPIDFGHYRGYQKWGGDEEEDREDYDYDEDEDEYEDEKVIDETRDNGEDILKFQPEKKDDGIDRLQMNMNNQ